MGKVVIRDKRTMAEEKLTDVYPSVFRVDVFGGGVKIDIQSLHHSDSKWKENVKKWEGWKKSKELMRQHINKRRMIGRNVKTWDRLLWGTITKMFEMGSKVYHTLKCPKKHLKITWRIEQTPGQIADKKALTPVVRENQTDRKIVHLVHPEKPHIRVISRAPQPYWLSEHDTVTYYFTSLYLHKGLEYLRNFMSGFNGREALFYGTGFIDKETSTYYITEILKPEMEKQSIVFVKGDLRSTAKMYRELDEHGLRMVLLAHIHPGGGPPGPSGTDMHHFNDLTKIRKDAIGLIYTRDGWMRFFTYPERPFTIKIFGNGVKKHGNDLFKIEMGEEGWQTDNRRESSENKKKTQEINVETPKNQVFQEVKT